MPQTKRELTERYRAVDDSGREYAIDVYTEYILVESYSSPPQWIERIKSHKMASNGNHVNVSREDGSLEEVATGRKMRRL